MIKKIVGGIITIAIGGTIYAVSESDIAKHFSENTGLTQEQAQDYINNIPESELDSFSKVGESFVSDGNDLLGENNKIDCDSYTYEWEKGSLSCWDGKNQIQTMGNDEIKLGKCYQSLDTDLGSSGKSRINECISDIDKVNSNYGLPIVSALLKNDTMADSRKTNEYNKSILEAALESKK